MSRSQTLFEDVNTNTMTLCIEILYVRRMTYRLLLRIAISPLTLNRSYINTQLTSRCIDYIGRSIINNNDVLVGQLAVSAPDRSIVDYVITLRWYEYLSKRSAFVVAHL